MRIVQLGILISILFLLSGTCNAMESARLFMATKGSHVAFLLPVLHMPSKREQDGYLTTVVEEVFKRSSVLYDESAPNIDIYPLAIKKCEVPQLLPLESQEKLDRIYAEIERYDIFKFPIPHLLQELNFAKFMVILLGPVVPDLANLPSGYVVRAPQVTTTLARKYKLAHESIESMADFRSIYCGLNLQTRIKTIDTFATAESVPSSAEEPHLSQYYERLRLCIIEALNKPDACLRLTPSDPAYVESQARRDIGHAKMVLTERNRLWIKKIIARSKTDGIPFYAFGAEHFLANAGGSGLLTQLQQAGFQVTIVRSLSTLPSHIQQKIDLRPRQ